MKTLECPREPDVLVAVLAGRFDDGSAEQSEDLQMHVHTCETCQEVVTVASTLRDDRRDALADVQVPAAGQVWWRAAIRARLEAAHAAARPITWAHGVAGACAAGLTGGVLTFAWPTVERAFSWLADQAWSVHPSTFAVADLTAALMQRTVPFALAAVCLLLAPLAVYFALSDE